MIWWCYDKGHENQSRNDQFSAHSIGHTTSLMSLVPSPLNYFSLLVELWILCLVPKCWFGGSLNLFPHATSHNLEFTTLILTLTVSIETAPFLNIPSIRNFVSSGKRLLSILWLVMLSLPLWIPSLTFWFLGSWELGQSWWGCYTSPTVRSQQF